MSAVGPAASRGGAFAAVVLAFTARGLIRNLRVPSIALPTVAMPVFFVVAFSGSFASAVQIEGYGTDEAVNWMAAWALLHGSAFSGVGAAGAAATDLENGFFDRIRLAPIRPTTVLVGLLGYSLVRALLPITAVLAVSFLFLGADLPGGVPGLVMIFVAGLGTAAVMSLLGLALIFTFRSLQALGLVQVIIFGLMFLSVGQAPLVAIEGWLHDVAAVNPLTRVIRMCRQGFLGDVTWAVTWPGLVALAGMLAALGPLAVWRFRRVA